LATSSPPFPEARIRVRPSRPVRSAAYLAGLVALAHGVNDTYAAFLAPLLPRIMDKMGLSIALAAMLATTLSLAASVLQPLMGYLSDRYGRRTFVVLGPLLSAVFLSLIGVTSSFGILVAFLLLGGLGSAVFHPPGASMAARISEGKGSGLRMSIFSLGGSLGWAIGPLLAVGLVGWIGLEKLWLAMVPGILVAVVLYLLLPPGRTGNGTLPPPSPRMILGTLRGPLGLLFGISVMGAFAQRVFLTMGPIVAARAGASEAAGALALSLYLATQALGTLAGGFLADRMDRGRLLAALSFLAFPAHFLAVALAPGQAPAFMMASAAGFFGMAMMPAIVVKAQELLPDSAAVGSGIVMGLAWGVGSLGVLVTGALGDWIGPREAAMVSMPALLLGTALALHPRLRERYRS
jgi:FSR family fosmidomycin resistance protein-like MFS transporter